jgi:hypothetical protein
MSYLLYCVFRSPPQLEPEAVTGVAAQPVLVIEHGGLGAAISELREPDSHPDVASVLVYESVVESLFRRRTVIPMRYGCVARDRAELAAVLDRHRQQCEALLQRFEGLAEMGIQVPAEPFPAGPFPAPAERPEAWAEASAEIGLASVRQARFDGSNRSGASYLSAKQLYYRGTDQKVERQNELAQAVCLPLAGLFVERKVELPSRGTSLLSLHFLVPRAAAEAFREASRQTLQDEFGNLRISGPWAPYNFAAFPHGGGIL